MASSNTILIAALIGGGYLLLSSKKSTPTKAAPQTKPADDTKPSNDTDGQDQEKWWFMDYDCKSITIHNKKAFAAEFINIINKIISEEKITKDNMFGLDPILLSKKIIKALSPVASTCANKKPANMTLDEKIIFFIIASAGLEELRRPLGIPYDLNNMDPDDYDLAANCAEPPKDEMIDYSTCEFFYNTNDPLYQKWLKTISIYRDQLKFYLGLQNMDDQIKDAGNKVKQTGSYP